MTAAAIKVKINWNELRAYYSSGINEVFKGAFQLPLHEKGNKSTYSRNNEAVFDLYDTSFFQIFL